MAIIRKINNFEEVYPAFGLCESLNVKGETGWYLPAVNELMNIPQSLRNQNYWSSTECDKTSSYYIVSKYKYTTEKLPAGNGVIAIHQF